MTDKVQIISPIDGPGLCRAALCRAVPRSRRPSPSAARPARSVAELTIKRARRVPASISVDALLARTTRSSPNSPGRWAGRCAMGGEKRGVEERSRHMIAIAAGERSRRRCEPDKPGFQPLHHARAAGHGAGDRAVELPLSHRGQLDRAGADGRQRGDPQARDADAAGRRALRRGLHGAPACPTGCSRTCVLNHADTDKLIALGQDRPRQLHRLGRRRPPHRARRGRHLLGARPRARRQGPGLCPRRCQSRRMRSRTWSTARSSTPARAAAASSASMCTTASTTASSNGFVELARGWTLGNPLEPETTLGPMAHRTLRRPRARADRRGAAQGRHGAAQRQALAATRTARPISRRRC